MNTGAQAEVPPGKLREVVTHLAMKSPPDRANPPVPPPGIAIVRRRRMAVADYLRLWRAIGDRWLWWSRLSQDEATVAADLAAPESEVYVAEAAGEAVGLVELDLRPAPDVELRYLGVIPSRIGTGLGGCLLAHGIAAAWRHAPRRMTLHTCSFDHPGARAFYEKHGFAVTHSEVFIVDDPRLTGLLPRDAGPHVPLAEPAAG